MVFEEIFAFMRSGCLRVGRQGAPSAGMTSNPKLTPQLWILSAALGLLGCTQPTTDASKEPEDAGTEVSPDACTTAPTIGSSCRSVSDLCGGQALCTGPVWECIGGEWARITVPCADGAPISDGM